MRSERERKNKKKTKKKPSFNLSIGDSEAKDGGSGGNKPANLDIDIDKEFPDVNEVSSPKEHGEMTSRSMKDLRFGGGGGTSPAAMNSPTRKTLQVPQRGDESPKRSSLSPKHSFNSGIIRSAMPRFARKRQDSSG